MSPAVPPLPARGSRPSERATRTAALGATVLVIVFAIVTGCSRGAVLGLETNTQAAADRPAVTAVQAQSVAERVLGEASVADALRTSAAMSTAFTGVALRTAASRYAVEASTQPGEQGTGEVLQPPSPPTRVIRTVGAAFPRLILTVTPAEDQNTRELAVLLSGSVLDPYRVDSRVRLLPQAEVPAVAPSGAAVLSATTTTGVGAQLAASPVDALRDYATLLQTGKSGGTTFGEDPVVASVRDNAKQQATQVSKIAAFRQSHTLAKDAVRVVATRDGGALVVGALERVDTFTVKKGKGHLAPPAAYKALAGGVTKITRSALVTTVEVVALVIPPKGKGAVQVIGFTELPESVTAR
jgi:hypothetical protein